jgi:predicted Zn-dependent protease
VNTTVSTSWSDEDIYLVAEYAYGLHLEGYNREAATIFDGLLVIDPHNIYCRDALAALSLALGRLEEAVQHASELLRALPNHSDSLARRCEAFIQLGKFNEAQRDLTALKQSHAVAHSRRMQLRLEAASEFIAHSSDAVSDGFSPLKRQVFRRLG